MGKPFNGVLPFFAQAKAYGYYGCSYDGAMILCHSEMGKGNCKIGRSIEKYGVTWGESYCIDCYNDIYNVYDSLTKSKLQEGTGRSSRVKRNPTC
jgi:hypothetical protein